MRPRPAGQEGVVRTNLEAIARSQYLLGIQNPGGLLKGKIEVELLRKRPGADWQPALPEPDGRIVFRVGDQLAFRILSHHPAPVFFNALDFDFTSKVGLVYPPAEGANEALESELPFEFGKRLGQQLFIKKFPDEYPGNEGQETLKLIVATREIDFSWMRQEGVRGVLETRTRSLTAPEEWTTVEVTFTVKKQ
jgi:hypothetical protein